MRRAEMPLGPTRLAVFAVSILALLAGAPPLPAQAPDTCQPAELEPWSAGPYGMNPRDLAADFTLPTTGGPWNFQTIWSGCDNYVFAQYYPGYQYAQDLWDSSIGDLLDRSPKNVQYFFLSYQSSPAAVLADVTYIRNRVD